MKLIQQLNQIINKYSKKMFIYSGGFLFLLFLLEMTFSNSQSNSLSLIVLNLITALKVGTFLFLFSFIGVLVLIEIYKILRIELSGKEIGTIEIVSNIKPLPPEKIVTFGYKESIAYNHSYSTYTGSSGKTSNRTTNTTKTVKTYKARFSDGEIVTYKGSTQDGTEIKRGKSGKVTVSFVFNNKEIETYEVELLDNDYTDYIGFILDKEGEQMEFDSFRKSIGKSVSFGSEIKKAMNTPLYKSK